MNMRKAPSMCQSSALEATGMSPLILCPQQYRFVLRCGIAPRKVLLHAAQLHTPAEGEEEARSAASARVSVRPSSLTHARLGSPLSHRQHPRPDSSQRRLPRPGSQTVWACLNESGCSRHV